VDTHHHGHPHLDNPSYQDDIHTVSHVDALDHKDCHAYNTLADYTNTSGALATGDWG
jgi:hypothetical protein